VLNKIKELADEAIKLQNKNRMDEVLREISVMCTPNVKQEITTQFGLASIKKEGCAVHPDEMSMDMKNPAYIKQAIKYMKDTGHSDAVFTRDSIITDEMRKGVKADE
jgi:hypothetical protein